ncbi:hypothetical protein ZWY2020_038428 [Hordeum vulgare]|nr:hypothetical protein ZWY2020_038428 [Hordeum vulgare]
MGLTSAHCFHPGWPKVNTDPSPSVGARQSTRLSSSRTFPDARVSTITEKAASRAAARNLSPGIAPSDPSTSCSSSRFSILGPDQLAHLGDVASDCDIVFHGEKGPRLERIAAICAKERLDEALAEARTRAEPRPDNGQSPIARGHNAATIRPASDDSGHREPRVEERPGHLDGSAITRGGPTTGRVLWGRPPTRFHPS